MLQNNKLVNPSRERKLMERRFSFSRWLRCQKFEGGGGYRRSVSAIIMQKQGGGGGEKDRARSKRRGRAGQIVGFMDRWRGDRGRRGEERTVLGSTPLCYRRNLSRSFREGGQASEGRGTGHGCEPCASPCPFLVPLFPYDLQRSSPLPPLPISRNAE